MSQLRRYTTKDYRFGLQLLSLRKKASLTQEEMASRMGVSEKAIRNWEGGASYPTGLHLKKLIETFLFSSAFTPGHERGNAKALWEQACENATHSNIPFDENWFDTLSQRQVSASTSPPTPTFLYKADWGEVLDVSSFYGREPELAELERWIIADRCRVVALLGMGGIGKTTLSAKLAQQVAPHFEFVLWRSLRNAPPLEEIVVDCIQLISDKHDIPLPQDTEECITFLLELLRERRCLLVLDNVDTIIRSGEFVGRYLKGYKGYGVLIERLAATMHQSCLLLTSREMPGKLEPLEGKHSPVRALKVFGLGQAASQELLKDKELFGTPEDWGVLVHNYAGNPLALQVAAATIRDVFGGSIAAFLHEGPVLLHTIRQLLDYQFQRLSQLEQDLMFWLAIERDLVPLEELTRNLAGAVPKREVLAALQSLRWRCLIERVEPGAVFTLHEEVLEYVTERLVEQICEEIIHELPALLLTHALMKAQSHVYLRDGQVRMLMQPILTTLVAHLGNEQELERHLMRIAHWLREQPLATQRYGGGNLINLLGCLKGQIKGADFSHLLIRQAYLQGVEAQDANFVGSDISDSLFIEPSESIVSMVLSPDGRYVAVGGFSGHIRVWYVADGKPLVTFRGNSRMVWGLAFNSDSTILASVGYTRSVKLWQIGGESSGRCLRTLQGHDKLVRSVAFSPDGTLLATGGEDETVRLWNVNDGTCLNVLQGHRGMIWSVAFSPDGTLLATGGEDETVRLWNVNDGTCLNVLQGHRGRVLAVVFHPQRDLFISGGEDGQIKRWDASSGRCLETLRLRTTRAMSIAFSPEGNVLAGGGEDGSVEVWQIEEEDTSHHLRTLKGHSIFASAVAFGPDNLLASIAHNGQVKFCDVESGRCLRTVQGYSKVISALAFNLAGNLLIQGDDTGMVRVWEVGRESSGRCLHTFEGHAGRIWSLVFSPDGKTFATSGADQSIKLWEMGREGSGRCLRTFLGHTWVIYSMAFSPDGSVLASSSFDQTVKLWRVDVEEGEACLKTLYGHTSAIWSVVFSPNGKLLASGDNDGVIKLWEVESGQCIKTLSCETTSIGVLNFSTDGTTIISSSNDEKVTLWEISTGHCLTIVPGHGLINWIRAMTFNQNATMLAIGSNDQSVKLWQLEETGTTHTYKTFSGHEGQVWSVAFSPDSRLLASGDDQGTLRVWDIQTEALYQVLRGDRPYERMNIRDVKGLTEAQKNSLKALGAIEEV